MSVIALAAPPSVADLAWTDIVAGLVLIPWAWWFDRHRALRTEAVAKT